MGVKENALCEWPFAGFAFNIRVFCDIATALYERPLLPRERFELDFGFVAWSQKYNLLEWHLSNIREDKVDRSLSSSFNWLLQMLRIPWETDEVELQASG
ncbi:hypothetical protein HO173_006962 [Letharia columbiana]|uniref:Uncharacterized protein n=1 Tax=Letharia columbiana TaxID=112416 RepID=A0A8H6FU22_9LECA|nr:uncharacterized protein HO173_006962 [Letharia columbiana]KAF6234742.1 hypothetical protein HO173_006962 [Letharia columbiana]